MRDRLTRIDGLRGLAIIGVIAVHATGFGAGQFGVQLFFLISGFILTYVASKDIFYPTSFFIKRFFRLAPLYYITLIICYLIGFNNQLEESVPIKALDISNLVWHISFLHGLHPDYLRSIIGIYWSLTPEVVFYLFFPLLFLLSGKSLVKCLVAALLLAPFAAPLGRLIFGNTAAVGLWIPKSPIVNMYLFIFGMLVYKYPDFFKKNVWKYIAFIAAALFLMCATGYGIRVANNISRVFFVNYNYGYVLLSFPFLVYSDYFLVKIIFNNSLTSLIGKISYSAFLLHGIVIAAIKNIFPIRIPLMIEFTLIMIITVLVCYLSYIYIEQPMIGLGSKIVKILDEKRISKTLVGKEFPAEI